MAAEKKPFNPLEMTDADFAKLSFPPPPEPKKDIPEEPPAEPPAEEPQETPEEPVAEEEPAPEGEPAPKEDPPAEEPEASPESEKKPALESKKEPEKKEEPASDEDKLKKDAQNLEKVEKTEPDYEAFYKQVMAPFKANGKLIQLSSPEEVIQLMQMGANYTKKMQAIQPQKKLLMMLENAQLLEEDKISFLIDLHQKNPEAIKKLLKDSNIDPVDIDTSKEHNYKGGTHRVSDQEASLQTAIENIKVLEGGLETLQSITQWDDASKQILYGQPDILDLIHKQRENGIYDLITTEMERRRALGLVPVGIGFLATYRTIGDELNAAGAFNKLAKPSSQAPKPVGGRTPVAKGPASTPPTKTPDNKVRAAAAPRAAPRKVEVKSNPLAMSDADFEKLSSKV
jgi:hypothetical protein